MSSSLELFTSRVSQILKVDPNQIPELFTDRYSSVRLNNLKLNSGKKVNLATKLNSLGNLVPLDWCPDTYVIKSNKNLITGIEEFRNGFYYVQNASSLLPVLALNPKPEEVILDACAAPGGKTFHIADLTKNEAFIYVNDNDKFRLSILKKQAAVYGVNLVHSFSLAAQHISKHTVQTFDKILLDAPCSGEGIISFSSPTPLLYWNLNKIKSLAVLQKNILEDMYKLLNAGGTIVYSTCTLAPEENEYVVSEFLTNHPDTYLEDIYTPFKKFIPNITNGLEFWDNCIFNPTLTKALRVLPTDYMQPFFVAKIKKNK
ncbi:MAG: RsmB/NOP family class I SAM-dependent RNA methyltransferase [Patescibacteria group bacterium]